jgi:hypothetical protein
VQSDEGFQSEVDRDLNEIQEMGQLKPSEWQWYKVYNMKSIEE